MRLKLVMLGKTRRPEFRVIINDYVKRISRYAPIEVTELRESEAALKKFTFDQPSTIVLLDDGGGIRTPKRLPSGSASIATAALGS
jgi:23S rRNA pseudoU1915 N3-methylase RlmH